MAPGSPEEELVSELSELVQVTLIYDPTLGSTPDLAPLSGKVIAVNPDMIPLPLRGTFLGQPGYSRQGASGWEWVLQGATDPVDAFVDSLTGKGGWTNSASRATVKLMIQRLFSAGISRTTIATQIPPFYQAIAAEVVAEQTP
jgi:hypothetical protein